jgi:branched-chain amino acid transport system substrate-binding protein
MLRKLALAGLLLAATAAHAQQVLKIGAVAGLSGPGAPWGQAIVYAGQLAAQDVNAKGGLEVGGTKYKVQIVPYDDKYQANESVTAVNRLIYDDKVKYILGPMGGASELAILPITEKNKVITMTLAFTPKSLGPDKPYSFRPVLTTTETAQAQIAWVVKNAGVKHVGALVPNDETGQQILVDLKKAYDKAGAPLKQAEMFDRSRVDLVPLLTRMIGNGIDAIDLNGNSPDTAGLIVKQARELGFKGLMIRSGGPATVQIVSVAGAAAAEGMIVNTLSDPSNQAVTAYAARYQKEYGKPMNGFSPAFYDMTHMLFDAMVKAGTVTDSEKVRQQLASVSHYQGIVGDVRWTGRAVYGIDQQIDAPFYLARVKGGKEVIVARCTIASCQ